MSKHPKLSVLKNVNKYVEVENQVKDKTPNDWYGESHLSFMKARKNNETSSKSTPSNQIAQHFVVRSASLHETYCGLCTIT